MWRVLSELLMTGLSWSETETNITSDLPPLVRLQTYTVHHPLPPSNPTPEKDGISSPSLYWSVLGEIPFYYCPSLQQTVVVSVGSYDDIFVCLDNGKNCAVVNARVNGTRLKTSLGLRRGPDEVCWEKNPKRGWNPQLKCPSSLLYTE